MVVYYSRDEKFVVAGHSDVASFLDCRSNANFLADLQMNAEKIEKPFLLSSLCMCNSAFLCRPNVLAQWTTGGPPGMPIGSPA